MSDQGRYEQPDSAEKAHVVNGDVEQSKEDGIGPTSSGSDDQPVKESSKESPAQEQKPSAEKKTSKLKAAWDKLGLDL